jgi:hypothetical protein
MIATLLWITITVGIVYILLLYRQLFAVREQYNTLKQRMLRDAPKLVKGLGESPRYNNKKNGVM